jgi:hypothetical protein
MKTLDMRHGNKERKDDDPSHVACIKFNNEEGECNVSVGCRPSCKGAVNALEVVQKAGNAA